MMTAVNQVAHEVAVAAGMAEFRPAVVSARQGNEGAAAEEAMVAPVGVSGGQQEEALGTAVGEVPQSGESGGLLPLRPGSGQGGRDRGGDHSGEIGGGKGRAKTEVPAVAAGHRARV